MYTPFFATGKVIQSPQYGKFLLLGSGTGVLFVGSEIWENFDSGIRNTGNFCLWDLKYGKFLLVGSAIRDVFACGI